jgi:hypothetical protein
LSNAQVKPKNGEGLSSVPEDGAASATNAPQEDGASAQSGDAEDYSGGTQDKDDQDVGEGDEDANTDDHSLCARCADNVHCESSLRYRGKPIDLFACYC